MFASAMTAREAMSARTRRRGTTNQRALNEDNDTQTRRTPRGERGRYGVKVVHGVVGMRKRYERIRNRVQRCGIV